MEMQNSLLRPVNSESFFKKTAETCNIAVMCITHAMNRSTEVAILVVTNNLNENRRMLLFSRPIVIYILRMKQEWPI